MKCKKHPRYRHIQKPKSGCLRCWFLYVFFRGTRKPRRTREQVEKDYNNT